MDPLGQPLGHPYGAHVPPAAGMTLYPDLRQQFHPLPQPFPFHPPSYPVVAPPAPSPAPAQGVFSPWEAAPSPVPPPLDYELEKRIEKLVEYVAKNGPQFETLMKEKQIGNPAYAFLFGAEGHSYYRYRLWLCVNGRVNPNYALPSAALLPALNSYNAPSLSLRADPRAPTPSPSALNSQIIPSLNLASGVALPSGSFPLGRENLLSQQLLLRQKPPVALFEPQQDACYEASKDESEPFKGLGGPLPPDVAAELDEVLVGLTGTKESIKGAKTWFMQRSIFSPALAEALRDYVFATEDAEKQLHVIYFINDILFSSLQKRINVKELDNEAHAFKPFLGVMLGAIYHNAANVEANRDRLVKILRFWGVKEVYDTDALNLVEREMMAGPPPGARKPLSSIQSPVGLPGSGLLGSTTLVSLNQMPVHSGQWQPDRIFQGFEQQKLDQLQHSYLSASADQQFLAASTELSVAAGQPLTSMSTLYSSLSSFLPPLTISTSVTQTTPSVTLNKSPYPHFPPGLIPGMARKIQVGSGVPYSPVSPLDIPTAIPPSTVTESYILERVAKFFHDIGEVDPLQGQQTASLEGNDKEEVEEFGRKGGACVPPPASILLNLMAGNDSNDGMKGLGTQTSRLGTTDFDDLKQSEDFINFLRKQRSTLYHTR